MRMKIFAGFALAFAACSDPAPVDMTGTYTVNITNGTNGCQLQNWTEGNSTSGIPVIITQNGGDANASIEGGTGVYVELVLGSRVFTGDVNGSHYNAEIIGTRTGNMGGCAYQYTATLAAGLARDTLTGTITYTPTTNHHADCGIYETCESVQDFNGLRPPK